MTRRPRREGPAGSLENKNSISLLSEGGEISSADPNNEVFGEGVDIKHEQVSCNIFRNPRLGRGRRIGHLCFQLFPLSCSKNFANNFSQA